MAATKTKKAPAKAAKRNPAPAASKTKSKGKKTEVPENPFAVGIKVGVWPPEEAEFVRSDEREPPSKPITTATVDKEGALAFSGLKKGSYIAVGEVAERGGRFGARFGQLAFVVK